MAEHGKLDFDLFCDALSLPYFAYQKGHSHAESLLFSQKIFKLVLKTNRDTQINLRPKAMNTRKRHSRIFSGVAFVVSCLVASISQAENTHGLFVSTSPIDSGRQMLLVIDPERQVLAVYHIETLSGEVSLRSTRALAYDLQLEDFNAEDPKPAAIKKMLRIDSAPKPPGSTIEIIPPSPQTTK